MPRRVSLPAADDLFRPTRDEAAPVDEEQPARVRAVPDEPEPDAKRKPSGRVRHDEKVTVYVTSEELVEIERTRLNLRSGHGLAVDRGRLVREAVSLVLADFEANGEGSSLVQRLSETDHG